MMVRWERKRGRKEEKRREEKATGEERRGEEKKRREETKREQRRKLKEGNALPVKVKLYVLPKPTAVFVSQCVSVSKGFKNWI